MLTANAPRIRTEVRVMFFDTDCGGVVHNIAYLRLVDTQKYPVVVRTEIDYRKGAKLGDRLVVEGWLDQLERVRFWCAFRIVRPQDEALIAECRQMLALVQMPDAKLLRLPDEWEKYRQPEASASA